jgi:hypothetical protein
MQLSTDLSKFKEFANPYTFRGIVGNKDVIGKIIGELDNPYHFVYRVKFGDGKVVDFYSIPDAPFFYVIDPRDKPYLSAAIADLRRFHMMPRGTDSYTMVNETGQLVSK